MATRQPKTSILTPTARLARAEKRRLSEELLAEGATAWRAPAVPSFSAWTGNLRDEALMTGAVESVPVSAALARMLWQQVIDTDVFVGEPRVHALAERAWRTIHEYRLQHPSDWLETAAIGSVCGKPLEPDRRRGRPFRAPHHTASGVALVGGGTRPRPGEISLAHNGVLFLDQLAISITLPDSLNHLTNCIYSIINRTLVMLFHDSSFAFTTRLRK